MLGIFIGEKLRKLLLLTFAAFSVLFYVFGDKEDDSAAQSDTASDEDSGSEDTDSKEEYAKHSR